MLDWIHICVFPSWKTGFKLSRHLLDTSSTPGYLSSFQTFSYRNLNRSSTTRWIDRESSWTLDSFSISGGLIELLFLCLYFIPRHLLDGFICRRCFSRHLPQKMARHLYLSRITEALYIGLSRSSSHFLDLSAPVHLPNHSLSLQTSFPSVLQAFSSFLHLVSIDSLIFMHLILWNLIFWDFCKIWGSSKSKRFLCNFWDGFWRFTLKNFTHCIPCAL